MLTLVIGLVIFGGLALSMLAYSPTGFSDQPAPATSDSGQGSGACCTADFPVGRDQPDHRGVQAAGLGVERSGRCWPRPSRVWSDPASSPRSPVRSIPTAAMVTPAALAQAHDQLAGFGTAASLPATPPSGVDLTPATYRAYQASAQYISADGRTILYPDHAASRTRHQHRGGRGHARRSGPRWPRVGRSIGATASGVNGDAALAADVGTLSGNDLHADHPHRVDRARHCCWPSCCAAWSHPSTWW